MMPAARTSPMPGIVVKVWEKALSSLEISLSSFLSCSCINLMFSRVIDKAKLFDSANRGCNLYERLAAVLSISAILLTSESLLLPLSGTNLN